MTEKQKTCLGFWKKDVLLMDKLKGMGISIPRLEGKSELKNPSCIYIEDSDLFTAVPKSDFDKLKEKLDFYEKETMEGLKKKLVELTLNDYEGFIPKEKVRKDIIGMREQLADLEHQQWAHWTDYLFKRLSLKPNSLKVDGKTRKDFERWVRQIITPYSDLSKKEKDADREWADKVIALTKKQLLGEKE